MVSQFTFILEITNLVNNTSAYRIWEIYYEVFEESACLIISLLFEHLYKFSYKKQYPIRCQPHSYLTTCR